MAGKKQAKINPSEVEADHNEKVNTDQIKGPGVLRRALLISKYKKNIQSDVNINCTKNKVVEGGDCKPPPIDILSRTRW